MRLTVDVNDDATIAILTIEAEGRMVVTQLLDAEADRLGAWIESLDLDMGADGGTPGEIH